MLEELIVNVSIGASRKAPVIPAADGALGEALREVADLPAEARLLSAVAILSQYQACGRAPRSVEVVPDPAAVESQSPCSRRAGDLLGQILAMSNTPAKERMVMQWLEQASRAGKHPPFALLPALLDYGAAYRAPRSAIATVTGTRGAWLMRQNPRWQFAAGESEDLRGLFSTGKREQRISAIRRMRQSEPAAARELIQTTWKDDSAEDRTAFVEAMTVSLSAADEAFLESALDDRSKQVRAAAADLLARLPGSALVARMIERAGKLLNFKAESKGLIRKTPAVIEISLPPDAFDPAWARDGIVEKPDEKIGRRQWWLRQIVAMVPPGHWSSTWNIAPDVCVSAAAGEYAEVVLTAWNQAAARHPDAKWITALLLTSAKQGRGPLVLGLLNQLPPEGQQAVTTEIIEAPATRFETIVQLLSLTQFPFDRQCAKALCRQIEQHVEANTSAYDWPVRQALPEAAVRIPPAFCDELAQRWTGQKWEPERKALDEFFLHMQIRRDLQREFQS